MSTHKPYVRLNVIMLYCLGPHTLFNHNTFMACTLGVIVTPGTILLLHSGLPN